MSGLFCAKQHMTARASHIAATQTFRPCSVGCYGCTLYRYAYMSRTAHTHTIAQYVAKLVAVIWLFILLEWNMLFARTPFALLPVSFWPLAWKSARYFLLSWNSSYVFRVRYLLGNEHMFTVQPPYDYLLFFYYPIIGIFWKYYAR